MSFWEKLKRLFLQDKPKSSRGFKECFGDGWALFPERKTKQSAGYDFYSPEEVVIPPGKTKILHTKVCSHMKDDEVLLLFIRSSLAIHHGLRLLNGVAVIDADYDQEIMLAIKNEGEEPYTVRKDERLVQGVFMKYLKVDNDKVLTERVGGIGSTT